MTGKGVRTEEAVSKWLAARGLGLAVFWYDRCPLEIMAASNPEAFYLLSGKSPRGDWSHVVIARGGRIVWDPAKKESTGWGRLDGPCPENGYWEIEILTPMLERADG